MASPAEKSRATARRIARFCVVGFSGVPVNLVTTWAAHEWVFVALAPERRTAGAYMLGIAVSIFTNFVLNDAWTWGNTSSKRSGWWGRLARFYAVSTLAACVQFFAAMGLVLGLALHYLLAQLIGIGVAS